MTQEDKDLLIKDLCARLSYGVRAEILNREDIRRQVEVSYGNICYVPEIGKGWWKECKPYLFPISSMTEEQKEEYDYECNKDLKALSHSVANRTYAKTLIATPLYYGIDWLNKNHFDYRGLIPMGLANDATGLNIY